MAAVGPWYISARAVREYLALTQRSAPVGADGWIEAGPGWSRAEGELVALAQTCAGKAPKVLRSGLLQYRGPRPLRLQLIVSPAPRDEGALPQLVSVLPQTTHR
ncbi:MAG: hypothetical protein ACK4N5_09935 [Myxococcales bacterium]